MAFFDFLKRFGRGSRDGGRSRPGVRRAGLPQRSSDAHTLRVPAVQPGGFQPAPPPGPTEVARAIPAAPVPEAAPHRAPIPQPMAAPPPAVARVPAPAPAASSSEATQYVRIGSPTPEGLVGILAGISGPLQGEVFKLQDGENLLGRENCNVLLRSPRISRFHARIQHMDGAFVIESNPEVFDKNPTRLNGEEIEADGLNDGDTLELGDCTFKFRII